MPQQHLASGRCMGAGDCMCWSCKLTPGCPGHEFKLVELPVFPWSCGPILLTHEFGVEHGPKGVTKENALLGC